MGCFLWRRADAPDSEEGDFLQKFEEQRILAGNLPFFVVGDFNLEPGELDVYDEGEIAAHAATDEEEQGHLLPTRWTANVASISLLPTLCFAACFEGGRRGS